MNKLQLRKIDRITSWVEQLNTMSSGEKINGSITWQLNRDEVDPNGFWLLGDNNNPERRWFDASLFVMVYIGSRGGVNLRYSKAHGINLKHIIH
jgi:hypothetical protein